jgi:hypothetical protein
MTENLDLSTLTKNQLKYQKNKERYLQYYQDNKEIMQENSRRSYKKRSCKVICECGTLVLNNKMLNHEKTNKHKNLIEIKRLKEVLELTK